MEYPTYYETIVHSEIWQEWIKYQEKHMDFDIHESIEIGALSPRHWEAFIQWVKSK